MIGVIATRSTTASSVCGYAWCDMPQKDTHVIAEVQPPSIRKRDIGPKAPVDQMYRENGYALCDQRSANGQGLLSSLVYPETT